VLRNLGWLADWSRSGKRLGGFTNHHSNRDAGQLDLRRAKALATATGGLEHLSRKTTVAHIASMVTPILVAPATRKVLDLEARCGRNRPLVRVAQGMLRLSLISAADEGSDR
jgi:hypothetical protein